MADLKNKIIFNKDEPLLDSSDYTFQSTISPIESEFSLKNRNAYLQYLVTGTFLLTMPAEGENLVKVTPVVNPLSYALILETYNKEINEPIASYLDVLNNFILKKYYSKQDLIIEILSFKSLNNNWDGYGSIPLEIESASNVLLLLDLIGEDGFCKLNEFFSNPNGTISLIWSNNSNEIISLEVGNETMSYYVELLSKETLFFNEIEVNQGEAKKISEFIQLL